MVNSKLHRPLQGREAPAYGLSARVSRSTNPASLLNHEWHKQGVTYGY
jgi:hypothetical protein